jgi:hypothetical protein
MKALVNLLLSDALVAQEITWMEFDFGSGFGAL